MGQSSLSMHTGRKHDYLGVDMEFMEDGTMEVSMFKYLEGVLEDFPEVIRGRSATPAASYLFDIRDKEKARRLEEERALAFQHTVAQLLLCWREYNASTQLLIKNGLMLSGKKTKHIKAKFFFIKDRVDDGEINVIDCPTTEMWADIMTKPLQGTAFWVMRTELMNCPVN